MNCERTLKCSSMLSSTACRGPITVRIKVTLYSPIFCCKKKKSICFIFQITDPILDEKISIKIQHNREKHQALINRQIATPADTDVMEIVIVQYYIRYFVVNLMKFIYVLIHLIHWVTPVTTGDY